MTRPSASRNWYEPGASGMLPGSGRATMPPLSRVGATTAVVLSRARREQDSGRRECYLVSTPARYPAQKIKLRGRQPRGVATGLSPAGRRGALPRYGEATTCCVFRLRSRTTTPSRPQTSSSQRIAAAKETLGDRLVILGHHYQRDEVIRWAEQIGDSFKLAQFAADNDQATDIVFCGVHFMAESADVLTGDHQRVILPDLNAGCSMADMADIDQVEEAWDEIGGRHRDRPRRPDHLHELRRPR